MPANFLSFLSMIKINYYIDDLINISQKIYILTSLTQI